MNKPKMVMAWLSSILLGLSFILAGLPKIVPGESMVNRFENWGYTAEFATMIGLLELLSGLLVLIPRCAFYGSCLIIVLMSGAIYTHVSTAIGSPLFAVVYLLMAAVLGAIRFNEAVKAFR